MIRIIDSYFNSPLRTAIYFFILLSIIIFFFNIPNIFVDNSDNIVSYKPVWSFTLIFLGLAVTNCIIILSGLKSKKFAVIFLRIIDPLLFILSLVAFGYALFLPCEGLSCIGNGYIFIIGILIMISLFIHIPALYHAQKSKQDISRLSLIIIGSFIFIQLLVDFGLQARYENKFNNLDIAVYVPTYLPEEMSTTPQSEWYKENAYEINYSDTNLISTLYIEGNIPPEHKADEILRDGGREITIRNTTGTILTKNDDLNPDYGYSTVIWIENGEEIEVTRRDATRNSSITLDLLEQDLLQSVESMQRVN